MNFNDVFENALELEQATKDLYELADKLQECLDVEFEWRLECNRVLLYYPIGGVNKAESDNANYLKQGAKTFYENFIACLRKINFMKFGMSLAFINDRKFNSIIDIEEFKQNINLNCEIIHRFINEKLQGNEFKKEYGEVIKAIKNIIDYIDIIKLKITTIKNIQFNLRQEIENSQCKIRLLNQDNSLENTIESLEIIKKLYSIICIIMEVDEQEEPARYSRVESGSFIIELLGNIDVITTIGGVIAFGYKVYNDHFSKKAKHEEKVRNLKIRGGLLKEIKKVRELKVEYKDVQNDLAQIEENLLKLYMNSWGIEVNGKQFGGVEIDENLVNRYIEERNANKLEE